MIPLNNILSINMSIALAVGAFSFRAAFFFTNCLFQLMLIGDPLPPPRKKTKFKLVRQILKGMMA